jgi:hypothetical protein
MIEAFVFDTYAIMEIIRGNQNYKEFLDKKIVINNFIFAELSYILFRDNYPNAELLLNKYSKFIIAIKPSMIIEAMKFRYENKEKNLSMTDCVSYLMSKDLNLKFLTGDKEFEKLDNVKFIKK